MMARKEEKYFRGDMRDFESWIETEFILSHSLKKNQTRKKTNFVNQILSRQTIFFKL